MCVKLTKQGRKRKETEFCVMVYVVGAGATVLPGAGSDHTSYETSIGNNGKLSRLLYYLLSKVSGGEKAII